MKKLILGACALSFAVSVLAQGTVIFNNRIVGTVVTKVYAPNPSNGSLTQSGNGTGDTPAGTTDWSAYTPLSGSGYTAQLWSGPSGTTDPNSLAAADPTTTMRSGAAAGFINQVTATLSNVAGDTPAAVLQVRVWDNRGGTITTWAQALATPGETMGSSPLFAVANVGGTLFPAATMNNLVSFNVTGAAVPEPSTFALMGLGAAALLIFRRRK